MNIHKLENKIHQMVDELQGLCSTVGLSNTPDEEVVVTSVFLYKFLNDKFMYNLEEFSKKINKPIKSILKNKNKCLEAFYDYNSQNVAFAYEDTIQYLINNVEQSNFYKQFDDALMSISNDPKNDKFTVKTAGGERTMLFEPLSRMVEEGQRNNFTKAIFGIIAQDKFDFSEAFNASFDFYASIFEYLIKNYNVASGTYAEYFTPQTVSSIMAKILVRMSKKIKAAEIYDGAAGSGSLILHLAHELGQEDGVNRAIVYTQDISTKSTRFLRLNMMLNGKTESLGNIIRGDTLESPAHFETPDKPASGLKKFSYITMNPPFKMDFSASRDRIEQKWQETDRFFAGIPKIKQNDKKKMEIYLCFLQHALYSLNDKGKAAVVVPTGFLTALFRGKGKKKKDGALAEGKLTIEGAIRQKIVDENMLTGVISMPSNIFANTRTNVSVIFLDKDNKHKDVILIDASKLGKKVKEGKNQKTVLQSDEVKKIINTFIERKKEDDFSVCVSFDDIKKKNYSFTAGQYFEVKIEHVDITAEQFAEKMDTYKTRLSENFKNGKKLENSILKQIGELKFEND